MATVQYSDEAQRIANSFIDARREKRGLAEYPGTKPESFDEAYAVQDIAIGLDGRAISGWKVGKIWPPLDGVNRLAGPIFDSLVFDATEEPLEMPIFAEGFGAAEAEFLLRFGKAPAPGKTSFTEEEAAELIDAVHIGIEIASSPFVGINENGPRVTISDFGNNYGMIIGDAIPNWREIDIRTWPVELWINGERIGAATAETMLDGPMGAVRYLLELMAARGIELTPGQWVSSGAVTGVHPVKPGDQVEARFNGDLVTKCVITAS